MTTRMTTILGVEGMSRYSTYEISDRETTMATAPDNKMGRRPHRSTMYHGGMVDKKYVMPLIPAISTAS